MTSAVDDLLALVRLEDPMRADPKLVAELQPRAMNERYQAQRGKIKALARRAEESNVGEIRQNNDVVPLMFSHAVYKSYPENLVADGRWDRLLLWFSTVSATPMDNVDLKGIVDVDDWVSRLDKAGHRLFATSGTGGKNSFLDQTDGDVERIGEVQSHIVGWPTPIAPKNDRVISILTSTTGPNNSVFMFRTYEKYFAKPGKAFAIEEPLLLAHLSQIQKMKQKIAAGTATPEEISTFEAQAKDRGKRMQDATAVLIDKILEHRHEPQIIKGYWGRAWQILETARARGIPDGDFHPDTFTEFGGGLKGLSLPADYIEQVQRFFAPARHTMNFGMAEMSTTCPRCEAGRYHVWPWNVMFILDETGTKALPTDNGPVQGRAAFFDMLPEGRWGGLVSGDRVTADYGACECGRPGPTIGKDIVRYSELNGEDDKLTCSAALEAYVRGIAST